MSVYERRLALAIHAQNDEISKAESTNKAKINATIVFGTVAFLLPELIEEFFCFFDSVLCALCCCVC